MGSSLEDSPMTLASSRLTSPQNSKGNIGSEGAEWARRRKNKQYLANKSPYLRNSAWQHHSHKSQWRTNRKSHTRFRLVPKSSTLDDPERPWTAKPQCGAEKLRLLEPTAQVWMKIDPYMQRQKCRPMTLVSANIRYMRILAGVPLGGGLKWEWGCRRQRRRFEWLLLRKLQR